MTPVDRSTSARLAAHVRRLLADKPRTEWEPTVKHAVKRMEPIRTRINHLREQIATRSTR